ncbi:MAG: bifunctional folylpolyglutamate synthase/dihydrofolate synthase [Ignavibacteria bacterium]|nr:bifunctional folylpolyglutamate synthase/dihydrofolate synthase [Ignavibacteria bacterium]
MKKFRNYKECVDYLFGLERVGIKYDLNNIRKLTALLGNPERKFKSVHIAGTNGKGSVASILSSFLTESGIKNGLYTSPHIVDFRERIRVNGKMIPEKYVMDFTEKIFSYIEKIKPSFFEVTTAMAFKYFADMKAEFAVIECGLGGRLDSTNIIRPEVSVITGISKDHSEYLGNTLKSITYEKAGIVKPCIPCVIGKLSKYIRKIVSETCVKKSSKLVDSSKYIVEVRKMTGESVYFDFGNEDFRFKGLTLPLTGNYQVHNLKTFFGILGQLVKKQNLIVTQKILNKAFRNLNKNTGFRCRFQIIQKNPYIICDVSHNSEGIKNMRENLKNLKFRRLIVIFGMMKDKEYAKCIKELENLGDYLILTKPDYKRAENPDELYAHIKRKANAVVSENVRDAFGLAGKITLKNDLIVITGSFFMVSDFLKFYNAK